METKKIDLKPCPFCGCKAVIEDISTEDERYYMIQCKNEECGASACFGDHSTTKKGTTDAWNKRVPTTHIKNDGHITINIGGKNGTR